MFRITTRSEGDNRKVLYLEGKLCRECVHELDAEIDRILGLGQNVVLDFSRVTFLHDDAAMHLRRFRADRVAKRNCSLYVRTMLNLKERGQSG